MPPGQIMRKQVPSDRTKDVLNFATKKPAQRLQSIRDGLGVSVRMVHIVYLVLIGFVIVGSSIWPIRICEGEYMITRASSLRSVLTCLYSNSACMLKSSRNQFALECCPHRHSSMVLALGNRTWYVSEVDRLQCFYLSNFSRPRGMGLGT